MAAILSVVRESLLRPLGKPSGQVQGGRNESKMCNNCCFPSWSLPHEFFVVMAKFFVSGTVPILCPVIP